MMLRWRYAALLSAVLVYPHRARAELSPEAERLARAWQAAGLTVTRLPPVFLERGRVRPVALPEAAWRDDPPCTSVALLSGRSVDFVVRLDPPPNSQPNAAAPAERSAAGVVLLSQCGPVREVLARLTIELRAARAALETVVAVGRRTAPAVGDVLTERAAGPVAALVDVGPRAALPPLAQRAHRAVVRDKLDGISEVRTKAFTAGPEGAGHQVLQVDDGCHRVDLLADASARRPLDLDADLRDASTDRLLARDRGDAPDVRLEWCAGEPTTADLLYVGAPGPVSVVMIDRRTTIAAGIPASWGPRARGGFARAFERRNLPRVEQPPIAEWLGVAGVTSFSAGVLPGVCYVAALATSRGEPRSVTLNVNVDSVVVYDVAVGRDDSAAVAFCAGSDTPLRFEAEVRGSAVAWVTSLWQVGARPLDEAR